VSGPIEERRDRSLAEVDAMPGQLRMCVHEFGYPIVKMCLQCGVKEPSHIRALVTAIWDGARSPADRPPHRDSVLSRLDWLLMQAEAPITAAALIRFLYAHNMVLIPRHPSKAMVEASIEATGHMGLVSKTQKHEGRLRAAIDAALRHMWPHVLKEYAAWGALASTAPEPLPSLGERAVVAKVT